MSIFLSSLLWEIDSGPVMPWKGFWLGGKCYILLNYSLLKYFTNTDTEALDEPPTHILLTPNKSVNSIYIFSPEYFPRRIKVESFQNSFLFFEIAISSLFAQVCQFPPRTEDILTEYSGEL